jgi:flagellar protein FliS
MQSAHTAYLETQIKTATPQKLRLMLIEAAIRESQQASDAHACGDAEAWAVRLDKARDLVTELIAGIRPGPHPLAETARALYAFIFRALSEAQLLSDVQKVHEALRVLEEERITWQQVCEIAPEPPEVPATDDFRHQEVVAAPADVQASPAGFSLEA